MNTTLLIMAAGLGSRYGGNKQIDRIGPNGEILMEYSIHDAIQAGFDKVVFVIRKSMADLFRQMIGDKIAKKVQVEYAFQEYDSLPGGFQAPADRTKPYGTVHAVTCAKNVIHEPFAVINADDYYGKDAFVAMADSLHRLQGTENRASMVAYYLKNTVSENGHVTRGVCTRDGEGNLVKVTVGSTLHPMAEEHFIQWIALETEQGNQRKTLKPGQEPTVTFALTPGDKVVAAYEYCNLHGLWKA